MGTVRTEHARLTPVFGFDEQGRSYRRGRRLWCPTCGTLGPTANYRAAVAQVGRHNRTVHP